MSPGTIPSQRTPVFVPIDAPGSIYDSIILNGQVIAMVPGATVSIFVRPLISRAPVINPSVPNAITIYPTDQDGNNVRHDWLTTDISSLGEGDFMAWWQFVLPGFGPKDSPEFPIYIGDHGPGVGSQIGMIVMGVTAHMPLTLSALRKDERFGDLWLQQQAEVIKWRVLGTTVSPDSESGLGIVFLDYLSKRLALQLINPAIEFWSRQWKTASSTQTSEVTSYPDMIASLKELAPRLVRELTQEWRDLMVIQPGLAMRTVTPLPASTLSGLLDPGYVTRNPLRTEGLMTGGRGWGMLTGPWPFP
jgi:hypothetical protein